MFKTVTFGEVASHITWGRAAAFLVRGAAVLFHDGEAAVQCYVDDPIMLARGDREVTRKPFAVVLAWLLTFGLRASQNKRRGRFARIEEKLLQ